MENVEIVTLEIQSDKFCPHLKEPCFRTLPGYITPSLASRAYKLAFIVSPIVPGVFSVGACVVDHWRVSCSCKAFRTQKQIHRNIVKPCVHFLAVFLAEGIEAWHSTSGEFIQVPTIKKWFCRLSGVPGVWEFIEGRDDGWLCFLSTDGEQSIFAPFADVTHFHPFYEVTP